MELPEYNEVRPTPRRRVVEDPATQVSVSFKILPLGWVARSEQPFFGNCEAVPPRPSPNQGGPRSQNFVKIWPIFGWLGTDSCEFIFTLSFFYNMYGSSMGTLSVDVSTDSGTTWIEEWTLSGNQGTQWYETYVDLSAYTSNISVRFQGITGTGFRSDMAIDLVRFIDFSLCRFYIFNR